MAILEPKFAGLCVGMSNLVAMAPSEMTSDDRWPSSLRNAKSARKRDRLGSAFAAAFTFARRLSLFSATLLMLRRGLEGLEPFLVFFIIILAR